MKQHSGFLPDQMDALFELLGRIAESFVHTLGENAEIVVHDLRSIDSSVVAIGGALTNRKVGAPIPDPEFLPEHLSTMTDDQLNYLTQTRDGHILCSSTVWIRDDHGKIVGAICINVDQSDIRLAQTILTRCVAQLPSIAPSAERAETPRLTTFARDIDQFVALALESTLQSVGKLPHQMSRADRISMISELDRQGIFQLRGAAETVAQQLGVSRATVFNYLRETRSQADDESSVVLSAPRMST